MDRQSVALAQPEPRVVKLERQFFGEPDKQGDALELDRVFKILRRHKLGLALFLIAGAIVGYMMATAETPLYRASNNIVVEPETSNRAEFLNDRLRYYVPKTFYETQQVIMTSRVVLEKVAQSLSPTVIDRLFSKPRENWLSRYYSDFKSRATGIGELVGLGGTTGPATSTGANRLLGEAPATRRIVSAISRGLSVDFGQTQQILRLSMVSSDPMVAAIVVNAVADAYIAYLVENRVSQTERAGEWLAERISESRIKLTDSENALKEFQFREQLLDLKTVKSLASSTLGSVNSALIDAEKNYAELSKKYGAKHPKLVEAKQNLANARQQFGRTSRTELSTNEDRFELSKLERAVNSDRELYELFSSRFNEVELGIDAVSSNTKVLDRASIPARPFSPNVVKSATTGATIGLLIGLLLLFGREFLDRTYKNQTDVEDRLKLPVLGVLPLLSETRRRKKLGKLVPERHYVTNIKSNFSEVINHIRTGIIYSNVDKPPKVILVTSALPQEGKTTCATNLASAFSKLGKTLLIDADFRKPRIANITNVKNINGLSGYVAGQNSLQECITQDAEMQNLYIMRSGEIPPNPLELISSKRFKETLALMRKNFDYIVIDSAPVIPVSDGIVLGKLADAIIMILKAGSTSYQLTDAAMKRFSSASLSPIGVVLSQLDYKQSHYYYSKYDYYTKEYYG